jgi:hypothetical protein
MKWYQVGAPGWSLLQVQFRNISLYHLVFIVKVMGFLDIIQSPDFSEDTTFRRVNYVTISSKYLVFKQVRTVDDVQEFHHVNNAPLSQTFRFVIDY